MTLSKYKKIMEKVRVDEEMKGRVLENLEREMDKEPSKEGGISPSFETIFIFISTVLS